MIAFSTYLRRNTISDHCTGVCACLGAAFSYAIAALCVKDGREGFSMLEVLMVRGLLQMALLGIIFLFRRESPWGPIDLRYWLVLRGVLGVAGVACYFAGISMLPIADSITIFSSKIAFAPLLGACFLGEKLQAVHCVALVLAGTGCALVAQEKGARAVDRSQSLAAVAVIVVLCGALLAAAVDVVLRYIMMRRSSLRAEVTVWYFCAVDVVILLIASGFLQNSFLASHSGPRSFKHGLALFGVGMFSIAGQQLMTIGLRHVPIALAVLLIQTETVHAFWLQAAFYHEIHFLSVCGAGLIVFGAVFLACNELCVDSSWGKLNDLPAEHEDDQLESVQPPVATFGASMQEHKAKVLEVTQP